MKALLQKLKAAFSDVFPLHTNKKMKVQEEVATCALEAGVRLSRLLRHEVLYWNRVAASEKAAKEKLEYTLRVAGISSRPYYFR